MRNAVPAFWLMTSVMLAGLAPATLHAQWSDSSRPQHAWLRGRFADALLKESSGVAVSGEHQGILWTINDSGNGPWLFATDTGGRAIARIPLDARNIDWEAVAVGPCPPGSCVYVGDIGDGAHGRREIGIYRLAEPDPAEPTLQQTEHLRATYPDGPHNAEAMLVDDGGNVWIITKGERGGPRVYRLPASAWQRDDVVTAEFVQTLPIPASEGLQHQVTDAAMAPDGKRVVVRTYGALYFLAMDRNRFEPDRTRPRCVVWGLEMQGEGVDWLGDGRLVLTSENGPLGGGGMIYLVECPGHRE